MHCGSVVLRFASSVGRHVVRWLPVALLLNAAASSTQQVQPRPVAKVELSELLGDKTSTSELRGNVAFVSTDSIALWVAERSEAAAECTLFTMRWTNGQLQPAARTERVNCTRAPYKQLQGGPDGGIIAGVRLFSSDLVRWRDLPSDFDAVSQTGRTIASSMGKSSVIYRLTPEPREIRTIPGSIRAMSDDDVVVRAGDAIRTETIDGHILGSFPLTELRCLPRVEIVNDEKLYVLDCGKHGFMDFRGKRLAWVRRLDGDLSYSGSGIGGHGLLLQMKTRKGSLLQNFREGPDKPWNGVSVWVLDTTNAQSCFHWQSPLANPEGEGGPPTSYSRAVSPTGEFVAIVTPTTLEVFRVPAPCGLE